MSHTLVAGSVADWTSRNFRCVTVIEKHGIDFHSEAELSLEDACRAHGLNLDQVRAELEAAAAPRQAVEGDWNAVSLRQLTAHINLRHHEYLKLELPRLRARLDRMASRHGERDGALLSRLHEVFVALQADLEMHLRKEEMVLHPLIDRYEAAAEQGLPLPVAHCGSVRGPIGVMEHEHSEATRMLAEMRRITRDYVPADYACANFRAVFRSLEELEADLKEHIRLENDFLHPRAAELERRLLA